jgi:hypothetical protein
MRGCSSFQVAVDTSGGCKPLAMSPHTVR